jgi:hypothetical protein
VWLAMAQPEFGKLAMAKFAVAVLVTLVGSCKNEDAALSAPLASAAASAPQSSSSPYVAPPHVSVVSLPVPSVPVWDGTVPRSLPECCKALARDAERARKPTRQFMERSAAICERAVKAGQSPKTAIHVVATSLGGAVMPRECRE